MIFLKLQLRMRGGERSAAKVTLPACKIKRKNV